MLLYLLDNIKHKRPQWNSAARFQGIHSFTTSLYDYFWVGPNPSLSQSRAWLESVWNWVSSWILDYQKRTSDRVMELKVQILNIKYFVLLTTIKMGQLVPQILFHQGCHLIFFAGKEKKGKFHPIQFFIWLAFKFKDTYIQLNEYHTDPYFL